jgi:hypothetical protein
LEITARLDLNDEKISERLRSPEYQSLLRKAFRDWSGTESEVKRTMVRNILAHAADVSLTTDDIVRMFLQWISIYSEMHFVVIRSIYNDNGVTRGRIWEKIGKEDVREDSAEADLFKLLIRDLSTGSIIRQHREKDYAGNFLRKPAKRTRKGKAVLTTVESAFDDTKGYELTELGQQFVHYAMTDLPVRIEFKHASENQDIGSGAQNTAHADDRYIPFCSRWGYCYRVSEPHFRHRICPDGRSESEACLNGECAGFLVIANYRRQSRASFVHPSNNSLRYDVASNTFHHIALKRLEKCNSFV